MQRVLRFALIGTGVGASLIAKAAKKLEEEGLITLCAVAGRRKARTETFAREYGFKRAYVGYVEMLRREELDVVAISTPHYLHFPMAIEAMEEGINVLVDKPMAISLEEADEMIRRAKRAGVKLGVVLQNRFDPNVRLVKKLVEEGSLGRLILGEAVVEWYRPAEYYSRSRWRGAWATEGGGALINQAIHTIDLLLWLMGRPAFLWAQMDTVAHDIEVEDLAVALVRFESGALGVIQGSTATYPGMPTRLEVHGTKGTAILEGGVIKLLEVMNRSVELPKAKRPKSKAWRAPEAVPIENHVSLLRDFVDAVIKDRKPLVDGYEGRRSLELIMAIYRSAKEGTVIRFPLRG